MFKVFWNTIGLYGLLLAIRPLLTPVVWLFATQEQKISLTVEVIWMDMLRRALAPHLVVSIVVAGLISWIVIIKLDSTEGIKKLLETIYFALCLDSRFQNHGSLSLFRNTGKANAG